MRPINDPVTTLKLVSALALAFENDALLPTGEVRIPVYGEPFLRRDYSVRLSSNGRTTDPRVILMHSSEESE